MKLIRMTLRGSGLLHGMIILYGMIILSIRHHRWIGTHQHCEYKEGKALLKVIYEGEWSGNILDSNFDSASYDGTGNYAIVFLCADFGIYSLTAQKMDGGNDPMQLVVQDHTNQTVESGLTTAEFGIVSLSGEC